MKKIYLSGISVAKMELGISVAKDELGISVAKKNSSRESKLRKNLPGGNLSCEKILQVGESQLQNKFTSRESQLRKKIMSRESELQKN